MIKNKKGYATELIMVFMLSLFLSLLFIWVIYLDSSYSKKRIERKITSLAIRNNNNLLGINLLRTPFESRTMAELLVESSINNKFAEFNVQTYSIIRQTYGDGIDWKIFVDENEVSTVTGKKEGVIHSNSSFYLPSTINNNPIKVDILTLKK